MEIFLLLFWLDAVFVNVGHATVAGGIYLLTRLAYPFVLGRVAGRGVPARIMPVTFTGYGVIAFFAGELLLALFFKG